MLDLFQLIQEADFALLDVERTRMGVDAAKYALETAKSDHDKAKTHFDAVITKADELGIPRAKLKKLVEERTAVIAASGFLSVPANKSGHQNATTPTKKAPRPKKNKEIEAAEATFDADANSESESIAQLDA